MVVLNMYGKIEPICISQKLKLYITNLPTDEDNNWNEELFEKLKETLEIYKMIDKRLNLKKDISIKDLYEKRFPNRNYNSNFSDDEGLHEIVDNMICIYLDYSYEEMPMGGWDTNPFDGRMCEKDYTELIIDFLNFIRSFFEGETPTWIYSSNYNGEIPYYRMLFLCSNTNICIESLKKFGELIDLFLQTKNDYLQLDYIIRSIHDDNEYNTYHFFKLYSLCQMFLENKDETKFDNKLSKFLNRRYSIKKRKNISRILRQMRNNIAHGNFDGFEEKVEEYARFAMDGHFSYDYTEYSRKNWAIINTCCLLEDAVRKMIWMLFTNKDELFEIKNRK